MQTNDSLKIQNSTYERKAGKKQELDEQYHLHVKKEQSWDGIQFEYELPQDDVFYGEFEAISENDDSLIEVILPTKKGEFRITSFILKKNTNKCQFAFSPLYDSNSISFRMSSYGGFSTGNIQIKNIKLSNLFPIKDSNELIDKINRLGPWFHQLNLMGVKTRLVNKTDSPSTRLGYTDYFTKQDFIDNPQWIWSKFKDSIPVELTGKTVLDVACNCGFYSFELAKRGANVIGIDNSYEDLVRAKFAKKVLEISNVDFRYGDVKNLEKDFDKKFDLVLCLGLLYHSQDPASIIKSVSKITDFAIFETIVDTKSDEIKLVEDATITSDGYVPTIPWLKNSFKEAGFQKVNHVTEPEFPRAVFLCKK